MTAILNEDVYSNKKTLYGKKGEVVKVIAVYDHVYIVEGSKGRFPVHKSKIMLNNVTEENTQ